MQKTISGTLQVVVEAIYGDHAKVKVNLVNRKGEVIWADNRNLAVGDSLNLMGGIFKIVPQEG